MTGSYNDNRKGKKKVFNNLFFLEFKLRKLSKFIFLAIDNEILKLQSFEILIG